MDRWFLGVLAIAVVPGLVFGQTEYPVFAETFESGLGDWTERTYISSGGNNDTPLVFDSTGVAPDGTPIYGTNTGYPGSHSAGYSSNVTAGWDGNSPQWLQKQWTGLPAGTYNVTLTADIYVYWSKTTNHWGVGNRMYVLTNSLYDNVAWNYDGAVSAGDGIRQDYWVGDDEDPPGTYPHNGIWRYVGGGGANDPPAITGQITTTTGNIELRLLFHEKDDGSQSVIWDNVHLVIEPAGGGDPVLDFTEDFESGYVEWDYLVWPGGSPPGPTNDAPTTFTATDPDLFWNINNPGSTSAGFSSNLANKDATSAAWIQRQFPSVVNPGTYDVRFEFDAYVYRYPWPNNDEFKLFPGPSGTGIYGPNTGYPGSQAVGTSYEPTAHDKTRFVYLQKLFPAAVEAGTYNITIDTDVYVYLEKATGQYQAGSRILVLTDGNYDNTTIDPNGGESATFQRISRWNHDGNGTWAHAQSTSKVITTTTGDIEFRLVSDDQMQVPPGKLTVAWDNVSLVLTPSGGGEPALSFSDDFESGYGNWAVNVYNNADPWGAGNRMYVLTDDQYDQPQWNFDSGDRGHGFSLDYWPGWIDAVDWSMNGVWWHVIHETQMTTLTGDIEVRLLHHDKNSGAQAVAWDNLSLTFTTIPPPCGQLRFDRDADGDVDHTDFALLQVCYTGDGDTLGLFDQPACFCFDTNNDLDVDQTDLLAFEGCASGPGVAADETCDDSLPPAVP